MIVVPSPLFSSYAGSHQPFTVYRFNVPESSSDEHDTVARKTEETIPTYRIQNVNVTKTDHGFQLTMDLPGIKPEDVAVTLNDTDVKVVATRKNGEQKSVRKYQREFTIDKKAINTSEITASLEDGVLTISFPKKPTPETVDLELLATDAPEADNDDGTFRFDLELPGVKRANLKVSAKGDTLSIQAKRSVGTTTSVLKRSFTVPEEVEISNASAYLVDGILTLLAPKKVITTSASSERVIPINKAPLLEESEEQDESKDPVVVETATTDAAEQENEEEEEDTVMIGNEH